MKRLGVCGGLLLVCLHSLALADGDGFSTIRAAGGGSIQYGRLQGRLSVQQATAEMLRNVYQQFGEKPRVGEVMKDDSGELQATFFSVIARSEGSRSIAGLIVVSIPKSGPARAAILTDDAGKFSGSLDAMLDELQSAVAEK